MGLEGPGDKKVRTHRQTPTDPDPDRPTLCGAIAAHADYLHTGDKEDFGHLYGHAVRGVKTLSVQLLLADLIAQGIASEP